MQLVQKGDDIHMYDQKGEWLALMPQPEIFESTVLGYDMVDAGNKATTGNYILKDNGDGTWMIGIKVPMSWLRNTSRAFPVYIDPTTNYYPNTSNLWTGRITSSTSSPTDGFVRVSSTTSVGWAKFNISSLPVNSTVSSAVYYGNYYSTSQASNKIVTVRDMSNVDPSAGATNTQIYNQAISGTLYSNSYIFGSTTYGWRNVTLGSSMNTNIQNRQSSPGYVQIGFVYSSGSTTFNYHYGKENTTNI
jgi:hypothetical protein